MKRFPFAAVPWAVCMLALTSSLGATVTAVAGASGFPRPVDAYVDPTGGNVLEVIAARAMAEPMNVAATVVFVLSITHLRNGPNPALGARGRAAASRAHRSFR